MPCQTIRNREAAFVTALILLYVLSVIVNFGLLELAGEEPRRAVVSIEMLHSGNIFRPTLFGWDYYNKPPVFNWVQAGFIWLTGSASELVLRLPSLLFYLLTAFVLYRFNRHFFPRHIALLSSFFLLTCGDVYFYGLANGAEIDLFYSFVVYLQAICVFWYYVKGKFLALFLSSYFLCAVGFLTKGFPSLVFQGLTLVALCAFARSLKPFFRWQHLVGMLLFFLVTGIYILFYSRYNPPPRLLINLLNESLIKSAIGERSGLVFNKAVLYPYLFLKLLLPWSLFFLMLFSKIKYGLWKNPAVRFSALFILCNLWVYWFTGQPKIRYVYMFLPFACTILAQIYHRFSEAFPQRLERILKSVFPFFVIVGVGVVLLPFWLQVSMAWVAFLTLALIGFLYCYLRFPVQRIWQLLAGIMLLRLVYAALIIPIQQDAIPGYRQPVASAAKATNRSSIQYLSKPVAFPVAITSKWFSFRSEIIVLPPLISYQVPYYYYLQTGKVMTFDSVPQSASRYFSLRSQLGEQPVDSLFSFFDRNMNEQAVFYRLPEQSKDAAMQTSLTQQ